MCYSFSGFDKAINRELAEEVEKMYKTVVIEYSPKADNMAEKIEEKANEMLQQEYELVTMSVTTTAKAILVFKK